MYPIALLISALQAENPELARSMQQHAAVLPEVLLVE
jgi:hypothetical protein